MERLDDIEQADYPNTPTVPLWLDDLKPTNFGKNADGIKLRDYAILKLDATLANAACKRWAWQR
jgi:hypothetical protein